NSEPMLMREVKNGNSLRMTEAIAKLLRNAPSDYSPPAFPDTKDLQAAAGWFIEIRRLFNRLTVDLRNSVATKRAQKIIDAIEKRNDNEFKKPCRWYRAVHLLKAATVSQKKQRAVINEVNPTQDKFPEYAKPTPEGVRAAVADYFANAAD